MLIAFSSGGVTESTPVRVDSDSVTGDPGQVDINVDSNTGVEFEDGDAMKCKALQPKMRCLAERLYPEKGASAGNICYASNVCPSEAELIGDKHYDTTYKLLPPPASDSESEASIPSVIYDENGNEAIIVGRVSVCSRSFPVDVLNPLPRMGSTNEKAWIHP